MWDMVTSYASSILSAYTRTLEMNVDKENCIVGNSLSPSSENIVKKPLNLVCGQTSFLPSVHEKSTSQPDDYNDCNGDSDGDDPFTLEVEVDEEVSVISFY